VQGSLLLLQQLSQAMLQHRRIKFQGIHLQHKRPRGRSTGAPYVMCCPARHLREASCKRQQLRNHPKILILFAGFAAPRVRTAEASSTEYRLACAVTQQKHDNSHGFYRNFIGIGELPAGGLMTCTTKARPGQQYVPVLA
jgi:hypothetical protein